MNTGNKACIRNQQIGPGPTSQYITGWIQGTFAANRCIYQLLPIGFWDSLGSPSSIEAATCDGPHGSVLSFGEQLHTSKLPMRGRIYGSFLKWGYPQSSSLMFFTFCYYIVNQAFWDSLIEGNPIWDHHHSWRMIGWSQQHTASIRITSHIFLHLSPFHIFCYIYVYIYIYNYIYI